LERARALGFLGPGAVEQHVDHAIGFAEVADAHLDRSPHAYLDLGTGGGVPGLVLTVHWAQATVILVESAQRRARHIRGELTLLGVEDRARVVEERAEVTAHAAEHRECFDVVTARSFAGPAATAEIASGLVAVGGILVVSEPPVPSPARWPDDGLAALGFGPPQSEHRRNAHFVVISKQSLTPPEVPRAVGKPAKRPRW
jgi:16S rRNA (guanine527-N7)-methyltransferase